MTKFSLHINAVTNIINFFYEYPPSLINSQEPIYSTFLSLFNPVQSDHKYMKKYVFHYVNMYLKTYFSVYYYIMK